MKEIKIGRLFNHLDRVNVISNDHKLGFLLLYQSDNAVDTVSNHGCTLCRRISLEKGS